MRRQGFLALGCVLFGFLAVLALRARPADPEARLPERFRLAGLIHREQTAAGDLRADVERLRADVERARRERASRGGGARDLEAVVGAARRAAGLEAVAGPGLKVTLDDAPRDERDRRPAEDVNDFVVHSQDVQAVVNALWRAGAEAMSVNGQRLVATSAVLCVGNTLLLNGTVHSPPYVVSAIGADRRRFEADSLVRRLHDIAGEFGLRFSVAADRSLRVPAFDGAATPRYARPVQVP